MKKIFIFLILGLFLFSLVGAASIGTIKQGEEMQITNYCQDGTCTYMNLTSITYPNGTTFNINAEMTKDGQNFAYDYTPMELGTYNFKTCGNPSGNYICDSDTFESTPSGNSGTSNLVFFVFVILFLYGINILGFFKENAIMTILGGMALIFLGAYIVNNGIIIYRDNLTNYIAYITIGWGLVSTIVAIYQEWLQDW